MSKLEDKFLKLWSENCPDLPLTREAELVPSRKFRFDFVHLPSRTAIEINGGIFTVGQHSSGKGIERDYAKANLAQINNYTIFHLSKSMINLNWIHLISQCIKARQKLPP